MSLQIWLPLNGNLNNQGLNNLSQAQVQTGCAIDNNGKIGKCYTNSGTTKAKATPCTFNASTFSICAWVKYNEKTSNWSRPIGMYGDGTYISLGCEHTNGTGIGFHFYKTIDGTNTGIFDNYTTTIQLNTWVHYAVTYSGTRYCVYENGIKIRDAAVASGRENTPCNMTTLYLFGGASNYYSKSSLNDVRFYDHCLSDKEVEEIAKGLVLHYKLNDIYTKTWSLPYYSRTVNLTTSNTYVYSIPTKTVYLTPGKQYTVGAQIKVNQPNISFYFDTNCTDENGVYSGNDAAQTVQYNPTISLIQNEWQQVWVTTTIKTDAGKPYYHHGFLFKTISGEYSTLCEIRNIVVYEGAAQITTEAMDKTNTVYDSSGYNNNGTIIGSLTSIKSNARYDMSTNFATNNDYFYFPHLVDSTAMNNEFTFACWVYRDYTDAVSRSIYYGLCQIYLYTDFKARITWNHASASLSYNSNNIWASGILIPYQTWTHLAFTFKNGILYAYANGIQYGPSNRSENGTFIRGTKGSPNGSIGYNWIGQLSDLRTYTTALTEAQVKELYNTSMSIDNLGNIYSRELVE